MLEQIARHARIIEGTTAIAGDGRRFTHFLQGGMFDGYKPVQALFPSELAAHRPRLGAIMYDLIPWLFPEVYLRDAEAAHTYLRLIPVLPHLDKVFTISESVRRDVIAIANLDPRRVVTIYGGFDEERWPVDPTDVDSDPTVVDPGGQSGTYGSHPSLLIENDEGESFAVPTPFWLYVGGDDFRKNPPRLVEALALLKSDGRLDAPLVLACSIESRRRIRCSP